MQERAVLLAACAASVQSLHLELNLTSSVRTQRGRGNNQKNSIGLELYCKNSEKCLWTLIVQRFICCFKNNLHLSR